MDESGVKLKQFGGDVLLNFLDVFCSGHVILSIFANETHKITIGKSNNLSLTPWMKHIIFLVVFIVPVPIAP